jgi:CheY-like chemotaxis protein
MNTSSQKQRSKEILLAVSNQELSELISTLLDDEFGDSVLPTNVRSETDAHRHLDQSRYKLLIVDISIPETRSSPRNEKAERGLELLKRVRNPIPSILITPIVDQRLSYEMRKLQDCWPVCTDEQFEDWLLKSVHEALDKRRTQPGQERVRITFTLDPENTAINQYLIEGIGFPYQFSNAIQIDKTTLRHLIEDSQDIQRVIDWPHWETKLRRVGEQLSQTLFFDNYVFSEYSKVKGSTRKVEIVFEIPRCAYPVIFEALVDPETMSRDPAAGGRAFWNVPIYRKLRNDRPADRYPLFQGSPKTSINCLIIESQVDGIVPYVKDARGEAITLPTLPNVPEEAKWLERYLEENRQKFGIGEVLRISADRLADRELNRSGDPTMKSWVQRELSRTDLDWHLVHYAGHCHYDESTKTGYIFFPDEAFVEHLDLAHFSAWLSRTRFVYLSGCNSSEEAFVFDLANNHVPAVLGFRWKIEDDPAAKYTEAFYEQLFEKDKKLEYAFVAARQKLRVAYQTKRTWAAPLLVMQLSSYGVAA